MKKCDELWGYCKISNGVLTEIHMFKELGKPIEYFNISKLPDEVIEKYLKKKLNLKMKLKNLNILFKFNKKTIKNYKQLQLIIF